MLPSSNNSNSCDRTDWSGTFFVIMPCQLLEYQFAFFDYGMGKLILKQIFAHLRVGGFFCKHYRQTANDGVNTGLWRGCDWKQLKWGGENLPCAFQRMQTGWNK